ncbi:hypothetical protein [Nocardia wallacei]|uniref:hypothetical protein n=1 Tax=Nocardia wallacei TaxID=480035 RepID=UPI00245710A1|nr:hypothetical protein [Nocardia wallacei]
MPDPTPTQALAQLIAGHRAILHRDGRHWTCQLCPEWQSQATGWNAHEEIETHRIDIILAAGWQPPPRVIETREEFLALPPGTVVRSHVHDREYRHRRLGWSMFGTSNVELEYGVPLPVTVLWAPEEADDA